MAKSMPIDGVDLKEKQRYVQGYLQVVSNLYQRKHFSSEQARLADAAYKRRLPPSRFVGLLRQQDPAYVQTNDYRMRYRDAMDIWNRVRPGRPAPQNYTSKYVHSSLTKPQLIENMQRGMQAQQAARFPAPPSTDRASYLRMREMLNSAFQDDHGSAAHDTLHRMIFSSKMSDVDIDNAIPELFGGKEALKWATGGGGGPARSKALPQPSLITAPAPFIGKKQNAFDIGVDDLSASLISSEF